MTEEQTLVLCKPDCMQRGLAGLVIDRFLKANLTIVAAKVQSLSEQLLQEHYAHIADQPFFPNIVDFMQQSPVLVLVLAGDQAVQRVRNLLGETDSQAATIGTIRGDFGLNKSQNICHASDSRESAKIEIMRFFPEGITLTKKVNY